MNLEPIIGLEIHVQLKTQSKMFCACPTRVDAQTLPNTNVCPVCLGHPGTLPVPNEQAIRYAVLFGMAVRGQVAERSKFDRKNYFYPDLPKGYQISQYDLPVVRGGFLDIRVPGGKRPEVRITLTRAHLEEDAAKNFHEGVHSFVDFNRGGTPLLEIVTEPDFRTPQEAKIFLQELQRLVRALGMSDGDMEKGHLRCDANISLRQQEKDGNTIGLPFNPKTEVKNMNSFRHVERALTHEIARQTALWESGTPPAMNTTRGWNDEKGRTEEQRVKEEAADYRYFPEPDIPPLALKDLEDALRPLLPELPQARRARFIEEYGFSFSEADRLTDAPAFADYAENVMSELAAWRKTRSETEGDAEGRPLAKTVGGWLVNIFAGFLNDRKSDIRITKVTPENFAELLTLVLSGRLTKANALVVLGRMMDSGEDPSQIMEAGSFGVVADAEGLAPIVERVVAFFPKEAERYRAGEEKLLQFFIGMVLRETNGNARAETVRRLLRERLGGENNA